MNSDWEGYEDKAPEIGDNARGVLMDQVTKLYEAEVRVAELETELKEAKQIVRNISEEQIPSTLEDMGLEEAVVDGGLKISIKETTHASPKADNRETVYNWLEEHGYGGLIKRNAIFRIGRDKEDEARALVASVKDFPGSFERKVEPATLKKFVNDALAEGVEVPMELFGAYTRRVAKVTDNRGN